MTAIVELCGVHKQHGSLVAVKDATLQIEEGEFVAIVGPSGSGKSSLLQLIGTLDRPNSGTIRIDGFDIESLDDDQLSALRAQRIGFVFQQFHLAPGETALENVANGMLYQGVSPTKRRKLAANALLRVGMGHRLRHKPHQLSGGERQRVAVARATAGSPALLLADEPTGNLDSASGDAVMGLLKELNQQGTTVLVITHDMDVAVNAPRRIHIRDGAIIDDERTPHG